MVKKEARLLERGRGSFIDQLVRMRPRKRHREENHWLQFPQWEASKEARDVNVPGKEDCKVRFLSSSPQQAKH